MKSKKKPQVDDLIKSIGELARARTQLANQAEQQYALEVEAILKAQSRDPQRIEHLLDGMLDFCVDPAMLFLYKKGPVLSCPCPGGDAGGKDTSSRGVETPLDL